MSDRTFTLEEAQSLIPVLEALLRRAMEGKKVIEQVENELQQVATRVFITGGLLLNPVALSRRKAERERALQRVKDAVAEIDATGVQVKDLDIGLLDFPCVVEDRTILLCWKLGEKKVAYWHDLEEGYKGRKPIDEKIAKARRKS
jgi:hypothetical protein